MALIKRKQADVFNPLRMLEEIQEEMNRLFDSSLSRVSSRADILAPAVDISEDENNIYVEADIPGFEQKEVKVSVSEDSLTIKAQREERKEEKKRNYYRVERFQGKLERVIPLEKAIDPSEVKAQYKNGVLKITLPKKEEGRSKEVTIEVE